MHSGPLLTVNGLRLRKIDKRDIGDNRMVRGGGRARERGREKERDREREGGGGSEGERERERERAS